MLLSTKQVVFAPNMRCGRGLSLSVIICSCETAVSDDDVLQNLH
jgi:hypothetical protein